MTGIYVAVERRGRVEAVEFEYLTDAEIAAFIKKQPPADGWAWAIRLAQWIRDNVEWKQ